MMKQAKINWKEQWKLFSDNFKDGYAHISLAPYGLKKTFSLLPGPGFGDLSHSTTRLMLHQMKGYIKDKTVIDIGSGSGILSIAAVLMGASHVYGVEIDPNALEHAKKNASLNHLSEKIDFTLPEQFIDRFSSNVIILMNMISYEQKLAWQMYKKNLSSYDLIITSGILQEQRSNYLRFTETLGWSPIKCIEESSWLSFLFQSIPK